MHTKIYNIYLFMFQVPSKMHLTKEKQIEIIVIDRSVRRRMVLLKFNRKHGKNTALDTVAKLIDKLIKNGNISVKV